MSSYSVNSSTLLQLYNSPLGGNTLSKSRGVSRELQQFKLKSYFLVALQELLALYFAVIW